MKNIFIYIALLAIGLTVSSCSEEIVSPVSDSPMLTIHLSSSDLQTKAPMAGVEQLNENFIKTIHYFLYPMGKTNEPALLHNSTNPITTSKQTLESFNVPLDETLLSKLFVYPQEKCKVFLIVNLPEGTVIPTDTSIDNLKKIAVEANFSSLPVGSFVMTGEGEATLLSRTMNPAAEGNINVDRVASKLTLNIKVKNTFRDGEGDDATIWTSQPKAMKVSLYNCVNNAELSGEPVQPTSSFDILERTFTVTTGTELTECAGDPFYSYPVEWAPGSEEEPYFFIMLPWTDETGDGTTYNPCYYKVILSDTHLVRNNWYNIDLTLGVLGSFNETEPEVVVSDRNYYVLNWRDASDNASDADVNADIHGARYLVLDQDVYYVYNQNSLRIPFLSSHDCEIVDMSASHLPNCATVTRPDYTTDIPNLNATVNWDSKWSLIIKDNNIHFEHVLNNDISNPPYDYAPYTIKFKLRHKDNGNVYYKDLTIIQYPAMMIQNDQNTDYADDNYNSNDDGFVYINNNGTMYGSISGLSGSNANPNMYIITTTVLDAGSANILGDPRKTVVDNLSNNNWGSNPALYNGTTRRKLLYYYPTDDGTENVLAPKFRIASSYGKTSTLSFANAERRCASYQEDGYPAGRWRVPTKAELFFIITLTSDGLIPVLFNNGGNYWAADGTVYSPNYNNDSVSEVNATSAYVRCVYDDWYWENSKYARLDDIETFTWGDLPREEFQ